MRLETVANFLPTPPGMSKLGTCSEQLQLCCWNVPASSADHPGPSGTPQWQCSTAGSQGLPENARKVLSMQLTVTMPTNAHVSFRKSICLMSIYPPPFRGEWKTKGIHRDSFQPDSHLGEKVAAGANRRASPLSYSSFPWQFPGLPKLTSPALQNWYSLPLYSLLWLAICISFH